jgi:CheY-like chemotaxis protein
MPEVLLIEPSSSDAVLMKEAFRETEAGVTIVRTGADALKYLEAKAPAARDWPDLVLYSLDSENADAARALAALKCGESTRRIPVVVLARLDTAAARQRWYDLHANCVIPRPTSFDQFRRVVQSIERFWFSIVTLPRE